MTMTASSGSGTAATTIELGQQLCASYAAARRLTLALQEAVQRGQTSLLPELLGQRGEVLAESRRLLAELGGTLSALPEALRERVLDEARALELQDDALRTLVSARVQELPRQLARIRGARPILRGYYGQGRVPDRPELVDRRG